MAAPDPNTSDRTEDIGSKSRKVVFLKEFKSNRFIRFGLFMLIALIIAVLLISTRFGTTYRSRTTNFGLKDIGELATQAGYFTNVQTISGSRQLFGLDIPLTKSKFIFSYNGVIRAGLDFGQISVTVDEQQHLVTIGLPQVRVLSVEIDEKSFEIYDESNNIFNPLGLEDMNLSLVELKKTAIETATQNGLLENARTNAEVLIRGFLAGSFDSAVYAFAFQSEDTEPDVL